MASVEWADSLLQTDVHTLCVDSLTRSSQFRNGTQQSERTPSDCAIGLILLTAAESEQATAEYSFV